MTENVTRFYDEFAAYQLRYLRRSNPRFIEIRRRLRPLLDERCPEAALDIGCGIGVLTERIADQVRHVVGVDVSPRNIEIAAALHSRPNFRVCAVPDEALPGGGFDLVTLFDVIEHFRPQDQSRVFDAIAEVVTEDALVVVNAPSRLTALQTKAELRQVIDEAVGADRIVALAAGIGMEPIVIDRYGVDAPNQYVFLAFSRTYPVSGLPEPARWARFENGLETVRLIRRYRSASAQDPGLRAEGR